MLNHYSTQSRRYFMLTSLMFGVGLATPSWSQESLVVDHLTNLDPQTLFVKGWSAYQQEQYHQAITLWSQAHLGYKQSGDRLNQARILNHLSSAWQAISHWSEAEASLQQSFTLLQQSDSVPSTLNWLAIQAQAITTQGHLRLAQGNATAALQFWQQATPIYQKLNDQQGIIGSQINQAQALQALGLNQQARQLLERLQHDLDALPPPSPLQIGAVTSLAMAFRSLGLLQDSKQLLEQALNQLPSESDPALLQIELGYTHHQLAYLAQAIGDLQTAQIEINTALSYVQSSWKQQSPSLQQQAFQLILYVDQLELATQAQNTTLLETSQTIIASLWPDLLQQGSQVSISRSSVIVLLQLAQTLNRLYQLSQTPTLPTVLAVAEQAYDQAHQLDDPRYQAFSLGLQAELFVEHSDWSQAQALAERALFQAQAIPAPEQSYRWQALLAQILQQQSRWDQSLVAYAGAYQTIQTLRRYPESLNVNLRFSFRDQIEPIYRGYVEALVQPEPVDSARLTQAREVIEALQLAELNNFFQDSCLNLISEPALQTLENLDSEAVVIYPIILSERLQVIVTFPDQTIQTFYTAIARDQVQQTLQVLRQELARVIDPTRFLQPAQQVYDWLIRPMGQQLRDQAIKRLVFVLDGDLRNTPMAGLYDQFKQQFLIEQFTIAVAPGLKLVVPRSLAESGQRSLQAGLSEARQGFKELPHVAQEIVAIASHVPSFQLLNARFTVPQLQQQLQQETYTMMHLATHGQFSSYADQTFILTWDDRLDIPQLEQLLAQDSDHDRMALLTLSACETAQGDNRATLGLAGIAVRSRADSTLASLWAVDDSSTGELMNVFYQQLVQGSEGRAAALQQAQLSLLHSQLYQHPFYWAPFIMVGNWL